MKINLAKTKSGAPAIWECGGASSNTFSVRIIAGAKGERLKPLFMPTRGDLSNGEHALFAAAQEMLILVACGRRPFTPAAYEADACEAHLCRIKKILEENNALYAECEEVSITSEIMVADFFAAAMAKADEYHCRRAFYFMED